MKKVYRKPMARHHDVEKNAFPALVAAATSIGPAAALVGGYAAGRGVTKVMEVNSFKACISLPTGSEKNDL